VGFCEPRISLFSKTIEGAEMKGRKTNGLDGLEIQRDSGLIPNAIMWGATSQDDINTDQRALQHQDTPLEDDELEDYEWA
jgi:hypothetical protein